MGRENVPQESKSCRNNLGMEETQLLYQGHQIGHDLFPYWSFKQQLITFYMLAKEAVGHT